MRIEEINRDNAKDLNQVDGAFKIDGKLVLFVQDDQIRYEVKKIQKRVKRYQVEEIDIRLRKAESQASAASKDLQVVTTRVAVQYSLIGPIVPFAPPEKSTTQSSAKSEFSDVSSTPMS